MTIGEVAERAGLSSSAIRFYEREGLLPAPRRRSGRRVYHRSVLELLALIRLAKHAGFSLAETGKLLHGFSRRTPPPQRWRKLVHGKRGELEDQIRRLQRMKSVLENLLNCDCPTLDDCGAKALARLEEEEHERGRSRGPAR